MSKEMREQINKVKNFGQFLNENSEQQNNSIIKFIKNNEITDDDFGRIGHSDTIYIENAIKAVDLTYEQIIKMIEDNYETIGELGEGETTAKSIINNIIKLKNSLGNF